MISHNGGLQLVGRSERSQVYHGSMSAASFRVDMLAVDPPWRQGNLSYWSHKAGIEQRWDGFVQTLAGHFSCEAVYLKVGVPECADWVAILRSRGFRVARWRTNYYAGENFQIVGCRAGRYSGCRPTDSRKSTDAIAEWAAKRGISSVADPCVGVGKMLAKFMRRGMRVVGVELVESRAQQAARRLCRA